jgi:hypothetical protein
MASSEQQARGTAVGAVLIVAGLIAGCASNAPVQRDTGNMAYPTPLPQGNLDTTRTGGIQTRDTGNMAYPTPLPQGNLDTTRVGGTTRDTGNMAYPTPLPQGTISNTRVR